MEILTYITKEFLLLVSTVAGGVYWLARLEGKVNQNARELEEVKKAVQKDYEKLDRRLDELRIEVRSDLKTISEDIKSLLRDNRG